MDPATPMTPAVVIGAFDVCGCSQSMVVIYVTSACVTGDNAPSPPQILEPPYIDLTIDRPPFALPYMRAVPTTEPPSLHFGKRSIATWQTRRM